MRRWKLLLVVLVVSAGCGGNDASPATTAAPVEGDAAAAVTTVATAQPAEAEESFVADSVDTGSLVLLSDDFEDGDTAGWDVDAGWFVSGSGSAHVLAAGDAAWAWWPDGEDWAARYIVRSSVRVDAGGLAVSLAVGPEGRYVVHLHETGTDVLLDRPWGAFEPLAGGAAITPGEWHALAVGVDGNQIQVYIDGTPIVSADLIRPIASGSVGFGAVSGSSVAVDNVLVSVLQGGLPAARFPDSQEVPSNSFDLAIDDPLDDPAPGGEALPDLDFAGIELDQATYAPDEPITVTVDVINAGSAASGPFSVAWEVVDVGCSVSVTSLEPGASASVQCTSAGIAEGVETWRVFIDDDDGVLESNEANNLGWGSIRVSGESAALPNLVPDHQIFLHYDRGGGLGPGLSIWPPNSDTVFGIGIYVDEVNGYQGEVGAFTIRFLVDGVPACSVDTTLSFEGPTPTCDHPGLQAGPHVLEAIVDAEGDIAETREDDNRYTHEFVVDQPAASDQVDMRVDLVVFDPPEPRAGEEFSVTVWVMADPATGPELDDYTVRWILEDGGVACEWGAAIRSGGVRCTWRFDEGGPYRWRARVDTTDTIVETNEDNNMISGVVHVANG